MSSKKPSPKGAIFQGIVQALRQELADGRYAPHDRIYSEKALSEKFSVNFATARRAVEELVREGVLYKIPSKGTFVAPQRKNRLILVVAPHPNNSLIRYCATERLLDSSYRFHEILEEEYLKHVDDLELLYPELCGIVFYRDERQIIHTFPDLEEKGLPFIFYGSSSHEQQLRHVSTFVYSEKEIVAAALDPAYQSGCRKFAIIYASAWAATLERFVQYLAWMKQHKLVPDPDWIIDVSQWSIDAAERHTMLRDMLKNGPLHDIDALLCSDDALGLQVLQAALDAGVKVPDQLKVAGINNSSFCDWTHPPLSSVEIPIAEDCERLAEALISLIEGKRTRVKLKSNVRLVRRSTL